MSFLIDPPLLVASGAAIERVLGTDEHAARRAESVVLAAFLGTSIALYCNADAAPLRLMWRPFGSKSGRDFMLNSGITRLPSDRVSPWVHVAAAAMFAVYPSWVRAGRLLARRAARSPAS